MITKNQIIAARNLLDWKQQDLADQSGVPIGTIKVLESGKTDTPRLATLTPLIQTFENHGILFTPNGGVDIRDDLCTILDGADGLRTFFDDVYSYTKQHGGEILISGVDETNFWEKYREVSEYHAERMSKLQNGFECFCLIKESDTQPNDVDYAEYRRVPDAVYADVPFYLYGDKMATILWLDKVKIIVLNHPDLTDAYRKQFKFIWKIAKQK